MWCFQQSEFTKYFQILFNLVHTFTLFDIPFAFSTGVSLFFNLVLPSFNLKNFFYHFLWCQSVIFRQMPVSLFRLTFKIFLLLWPNSLGYYYYFFLCFFLLLQTLKIAVHYLLVFIVSSKKLVIIFLFLDVFKIFWLSLVFSSFHCNVFAWVLLTLDLWINITQFLKILRHYGLNTFFCPFYLSL